MSARVLEVPFEVKIQALEGQIERQKNLSANNRQLILELERLRTACLTDVNGIIGSKQKDYVTLHDQIRKNLVEPQKVFGPQVEMEREEANQRKKRISQSQDLIGRLGLDAAKVKEVFNGYRQRADSVVDEYFRPKTPSPYVVADRSLLPLPAVSPWMWFSPPYFSGFGEAYAFGSRGIHACTHYEDHLTGKISTISYLEIKDASDSDYARTQANSEIKIQPFQVDVSGKIEAWLVLRSDTSDYHGGMDDEWGWSDITVKQQSFPYMTLYGFNGGTSTLFDFQKGECDCSWSGKVARANPGDLRFIHLTTQGAIAANLWAILSFGISDQNYAWVNDYSVHMTMTNSWYIDSIAVRTGVP
jgi:hypothetical protein